MEEELRFDGDRDRGGAVWARDGLHIGLPSRMTM